MDIQHPIQEAIIISKNRLWLTSSDKSALVGYLLDGFPIYGPEDELGNSLTTADLNEYHGHIHANR